MAARAAVLTSRSCRSFNAPLGSLANRIFNPPTAEKHEASENAVAENTPAVTAEAAPSPEPSPAPKVAPDA